MYKSNWCHNIKQQLKQKPLQNRQNKDIYVSDLSNQYFLIRWLIKCALIQIGDFFLLCLK